MIRDNELNGVLCGIREGRLDAEDLRGIISDFDQWVELSESEIATVIRRQRETINEDEYPSYSIGRRRDREVLANICRLGDLSRGLEDQCQAIKYQLLTYDKAVNVLREMVEYINAGRDPHPGTDPHRDARDAIAAVDEMLRT